MDNDRLYMILSLTLFVICDPKPRISLYIVTIVVDLCSVGDPSFLL